MGNGQRIQGWSIDFESMLETCSLAQVLQAIVLIEETGPSSVVTVDCKASATALTVPALGNINNLQNVA